MNKNKLSVNAIENYFDINTNSSNRVDHLLQVVSYSEQPVDNGKKSMYIASLSDSINSYNAFIIPKVEAISLYDTLRVYEVYALESTNKQKPRFIIKSYELFDKENKGIIGSPVEYSKSSSLVADKMTGNLPESKSLVEDKSPIKKHAEKVELEKPKHKLYMQISSLNTFSRDIVLLVRVTDKSELKTYKNEKGDGNLFNFNVMDQEGNQVQVTCFNKVALKYYNILNEGNVYEINGGYVKLNNKKFNAVNSDYQIILNDSSLIKEVQDEGNIKNIKLDLKKLADLPSLSMHSSIDTIGYVVEASEKSICKTKNGEMTMRKIFIADESGYKVELPLWKKHADLPIEVGDILLIKNASVSEFQGRNISATDNTRITINPRSFKEVNDLSNWINEYHGEYKTYMKKDKKEDGDESEEKINKDQVYRLQEVMNLMDCSKKEDLSPYCTIKGVIIFFVHSEKNFYAGCPTKKCKKKLIEEDTSNYFCTACNVSYKVPNYYMTLSFRVKDCCSEHWVDLFGNTAEKFLNIKVDEYRDVLLSGNTKRLEEISRNIEFKEFFMTVRAKAISFNNILKRKINVYKTLLKLYKST